MGKSRSLIPDSGPTSSKPSGALLLGESWSESLMQEGLENSRVGLEHALNRAIVAYLQQLALGGASTNLVLQLTLQWTAEQAFTLRARLQKA